MKINKTSILLTSVCFNKLIDCLHEKFMSKHKLVILPKTSQLYGYGTFEENKPSLKNDFEVLGNDFVNGKYLYDKTRSVYKGKTTVKLNAYYNNLILLYLGYKDIYEFLKDDYLSKDETDKQLFLLNGKSSNLTYYYVSYYFGEDKTIIKGQTIISDNYTKIKHIYLYRQADKTFIEHYCFGNIVRREDTLHISSKTLLDGKIVEGNSEVYYIGHNDPDNINYLIGTYCAYDIYTHIVAGSTILEKCASYEEMITKSKEEHIPSYIVQEIRNSRITKLNIVPNNSLELSSKSPYSLIYKALAGTYELRFFRDNVFIGDLKFKIENNSYKIIPLVENVYIENDKIELFNKGSVVHFSFELAGIISFDRLDIYLKTYYLKENNETVEGVFSGVDNENRLINGIVNINFVSL